MMNPRTIVLATLALTVCFLGASCRQQTARREGGSQVRTATRGQYAPPHPKLQSLIAETELIAVGRILEVSSFLTEEEDPRIIPQAYTIYDFKVERCLKGTSAKAGDALHVLQWAGPLPPNVAVADGEYQRLLEQGQRYLLFMLKLRCADKSYTQIGGDEYVIMDMDPGVLLREGRAYPHTPNTPIGKRLTKLNPTEEQLIAMVEQAVQESAKPNQ